ncbi:hypothetical protein BGZ93_008502 [Podila epicladia]|nr:hypothetical protein BGZ93_008502 [Podila epicladia]
MALKRKTDREVKPAVDMAAGEYSKKAKVLVSAGLSSIFSKFDPLSLYTSPRQANDNQTSRPLGWVGAYPHLASMQGAFSRLDRDSLQDRVPHPTAYGRRGQHRSTPSLSSLSSESSRPYQLKPYIKLPSSIAPTSQFGRSQATPSDDGSRSSPQSDDSGRFTLEDAIKDTYWQSTKAHLSPSEQDRTVPNQQRYREAQQTPTKTTSQNNGGFEDMIGLLMWTENLLDGHMFSRDQLGSGPSVAEVKKDLPGYQGIVAEHERIDRELSEEFEPKQEQLMPLSKDEVKKVQTALSDGHGQVVEGFNVSIMKKDIHTLRPGEWLNDEVINFYGQLIMARNKESTALPKVHVFSTFFYKTLSESGYDKVRRWTKKVNVFAMDYLLVPIHCSGNHWTSAVIDMKKKQVEYYDSLLGNNPKCFLQNGYDCGVFTCSFIERKSRGMAKFDFSQQNMPLLRQKMVLNIINKSL